ncbi:Type I methionyl aminopeptidase [Planctomycetales bacterium 10988]|nr:Type I methionyl aminopeptidase [Planctomycetales bacterium 10988]
MSRSSSRWMSLKSPRELKLMREAGLINFQAHRIVAELVRPGIKTGDIEAAVAAHFEKEGVIPLFKGVPGVTPYPAVTCLSVNEQIVHGIPGDRVLQEGDVLSVDTGNKKNGWCADSAYTHPIGKVSPEASHLLQVTKKTLEIAIEKMGTCQRWSEVAAAMEAYVKDEGLTVVENFVGHGIGKEMHEAPQVPNYVPSDFSRRNDFELRPGLVLAVEPMVNLGTDKTITEDDHWTVSTADGKASAHFEHTIAITEDGPLLLTAGPEGERWPDEIIV